jgi:peptidoglycan L-alanyl-D-glutamate endopeptidase CwlK
MTATERRLATLEPEFKAKVEILLGELETQGIKCVVTSGRRTMAEQAKLYAQGRTTHGAIVTKAPPGSSAHNFGYAVDLCPLNPEIGRAHV